jgi:hypothetical protein
VVVLGGKPDVEVGAQRPGYLLGEEGAQAVAGDPADDLADQESPGERVVASQGLAEADPAIVARDPRVHHDQEPVRLMLADRGVQE